MNVHEALARERKVLAIVLQAWHELDDADRLDPSVPQRLSKSPRLYSGARGFRDALARRAGQEPPSDETWRMVVQLMARLIEAERRGQPSECLSCGGAGELARCECASNCGGYICGGFVTCPECSGTRKAPCNVCSGATAKRVTEDGLVCETCAGDGVALALRGD